MTRANLRQKLAAEAVGTFMLTLTAMGVDILFFSGARVDDVSRWLARGFVAAAAIFALSTRSGAHLNPAVTVGFALRRVFPWPRVGFYIAAQSIGALAAAGLAFALFGRTAALGASHPGPEFSQLQAACCECVLTAIMMFVILATAAEEAVVGKEAALAVGLVIAACGFCAGSISGASMNPARTIVPQLISGQLSLIWVYLAGPFTGAALGVAIHYYIFGAPKAPEVKSARGR